MAVNQAQVDHIISTASADDPEVKLLKIQDEVELIKTSIKRLLIDIRERMNDMDNPIVIRGSSSGADEGLSRMRHETTETAHHAEPAAEPVKVIYEVAKSEDQGPGPAMEQPAVHAPLANTHPGGFSTPQTGSQQAASGGSFDLLSALKAQIGAMPSDEEPASRDLAAQKVRLQKVFQLFEWTSRNVKQFGHDRVDLMLDAYHAMGYISDMSCKLVKDMTRLMPTSIGELHEIKADEFVSELYELNHILNPTDSTLDRDMIEVLMEKREGKDTQKLLGPARQKDEETAREYLQSRDEL